MSSTISQMSLSEVSYVPVFKPESCCLASSVVKRIQECVAPIFTAIQEMFRFIFSCCYKVEESLSVSTPSVEIQELPNLSIETKSPATSRVDSPTGDLRDLTRILTDALGGNSAAHLRRNSSVNSIGSEETVSAGTNLLNGITPLLNELFDDLERNYSPNNSYNPIGDEEIQVLVAEERPVSPPTVLSENEKKSVNDFIFMKAEKVSTNMFTRKSSWNATAYKGLQDGVYALKALDVLSCLLENKESIKTMGETTKWKSLLITKISTELAAEAKEKLPLRANALAAALETNPEKLQATANKIAGFMAFAQGQELIEYVCSYAVSAL